MTYTDEQKEVLAKYEAELIRLQKKQNTFGWLSILSAVVAIFFIVWATLKYYIDHESVLWLLITSIISAVIFFIFFLVWGLHASKRMADKAEYDNIVMKFNFISEHPEIFTQKDEK